MLRFASDENFSGVLVRGLKNQLPDLDLVRIQDTNIYTADDEIVLEWAANENRILLTHDLNTIPKYAYERVRDGKLMPGVFAIPRFAPVNKVLEDLLIIAECSLNNECENQVVFLPF